MTSSPESSPAPNDDFGAYAAEVKRELWGIPDPEHDEYHQAKFLGCAADGTIPGWSMRAWQEERWRDVKPFGTRDCTSATHPRRKR